METILYWADVLLKIKAFQVEPPKKTEYFSLYEFHSLSFPLLLTAYFPFCWILYGGTLIGQDKHAIQIKENHKK